MSLLHAVLNISKDKAAILPATTLDRFRHAITNLPTEARARYLYDSKEIEAMHMAAAWVGDSAVPSPEEDNFNNFITFARGRDGHLWELNGGMKGPVDRGALEEGEGLMSERALELGVKGFLKFAAEEDVGFSIVALAPRNE